MLGRLHSSRPSPPPCLRHCDSLVHLDMSRSKIKGSINGAAFASMSKLATLAISNNPKLEGRVPAEVLDLPSLTHLDMP